MSALDRVQLSDLDEEQQQVAELIGLDNYKRLVTVFGGLSIYIPKRTPGSGWPATNRSARSSTGTTSRSWLEGTD